MCEQRMPSIAFPPLTWMHVCTCSTKINGLCLLLPMFPVLHDGICSALAQYAAPCSHKSKLDNLVQVVLV
jgi:hypothetical protein